MYKPVFLLDNMPEPEIQKYVFTETRNSVRGLA